MAASRRHTCGSLFGLEPLHACCITSCFNMGKGMKLDVKNLYVIHDRIDSLKANLRFCVTGGMRFIDLKLETANHARIPMSQCILAASLFFGLLISNSVHYETSDGTEDEAEEEGPARWDAHWIRCLGSSDSSHFTVSIFTHYSLIDICRDGRSLFRSIIYEDTSKRKRTIPTGDAMLYQVDQLRRKVVEAIDKRRNYVECFTEGDYEEYIQRMARNETLGGEVEIAMACDIIMAPIRVFRHDKDLGGLVVLEEYGSIVYGGVDPIDLLYQEEKQRIK